MSLNLSNGRWQGLGSWAVRGSRAIILPVDFTNPFVSLKAENRNNNSSRWIKAGEVYQVMPFIGLQQGEFNRFFLPFNQSSIFEFSNVSTYQVKFKPVDWNKITLLTAWRWIPNPVSPVAVIAPIPCPIQQGEITIFNAGIPL